MNYIKYVKKKPDGSSIKISYELDSSLGNNESLFNICDEKYSDIIGTNIKKGADPFKSRKSKVKFFFKNIYIDWWKTQIRGASTSTSFAMHQNTYDLDGALPEHHLDI